MAAAVPGEGLQEKGDTAIVPFSYNNPFWDGLQAQERVYELQGKRVSLKQGWEADGRGGSKLGFGASVYDAAFILAHFVAEVEPALCSDRVVLDIGTGLGLTSVAAALAGARCVLATDGDDDLLQRLTLPNLRSAADESLQGFAVVNGGAEAMEPPCIAVQRLLWGAAADIDSVRRGCAQAGVPRPDVILAADIVALPYEEALPSLLDTLHALAGPDTHVYIAYKPRHVCEKKWFHRARQRCSVEELPPESSLHKDFQGSSIRIMHLWKWRHAAAQTQKPAGEVPAASPALPAPEP